MKLNIPPLSQRDSRWGRKHLGNSNLSISNYGCLLTCHSMFLRYLGQDLLPDALNEVYKNKGVFPKNFPAIINFYAAGEAFESTWNAEEYYQCILKPCDLSKIDKLLDQKMPVIAKVDFDANPATTGDWHFVLIIGKENDSYLINDPYYGETYFFEAKYGKPERMIYGLRIYTGKEVPNGESCEDKLSDCKTEVTRTSKLLEGQTNKLAQKDGEIRILKEELEKQGAENVDLAKQILESRNQRDTAVREKKELDKEVEKLNETIDSANVGLMNTETEIKRLEALLKTSVSMQIKQIGLWKTLRLYFARG